jgi:hypothetical protein
MSFESKSSTKRDGWALGDEVLVLPPVAGSCYIGSLVIAKETPHNGGDDRRGSWGEARQGNASRFEEQDWVPLAWAVKRLDGFSLGVAA